MQQIYWYVTAVIAARYGIQIHAIQVLSTHIHEVLTDIHGNLPKFTRERNRLLANALKVHRKWPEEVFQRAPANYTRLYGPQAILKQIAYTIANVVRAGLVKHPSEWPGVTVLAQDIGTRTIEVERPSLYFNPDNPIWPERATLDITIPATLIDAFGSSASEMLVAAVEAAIESARKVAIQNGHAITPRADRICREPTSRRSKSFSPFGARNPTFSAAGVRERSDEAVAERKTFLEQYRRALDALKKGIGAILFPTGTWRWARELLPDWMRQPTRHVVSSIPLPPWCDQDAKPLQ